MVTLFDSPELATFKAEILSQPNKLAALGQSPLNTDDTGALQLQQALAKTDMVLGIGEGSSLHALRICRDSIITATGKPCLAVTPNVAQDLFLSPQVVQQQHPLVFLVSQSGKTGSMIAFVEQWHKQQHPGTLVLLTNTTDSPLASHPAVHTTIPILADKEVSIPATKTLSLTIGRLLQWLDAYFPSDNTTPKRLQSFTQGILQGIQHCELSSAGYIDVALPTIAKVPIPSPWVLLAPSPWIHVLEELQLKWMEITGMSIHAYSYEAFMHGPRALLAPQLSSATGPALWVWQCPGYSFPETLHQQLHPQLTGGVFQYQPQHGGFTPLHNFSALKAPLATNNNAMHPLTVSGSMLATGQWLGMVWSQLGQHSPNHPLLAKAVTHTPIT